MDSENNQHKHDKNNLFAKIVSSNQRGFYYFRKARVFEEKLNKMVFIIIQKFTKLSKHLKL